MCQEPRVIPLPYTAPFDRFASPNMRDTEPTRNSAGVSWRTFSVLGLMAGLLSACDAPGPKPAFDLGTFAPASLEEIIAHSHGLKAPGIEIEFISRQFLGVPYGESRLIGDADTPETLTINLAALDCYTYIDYVEALIGVSRFQRPSGRCSLCTGAGGLADAAPLLFRLGRERRTHSGRYRRGWRRCRRGDRQASESRCRGRAGA